MVPSGETTDGVGRAAVARVAIAYHGKPAAKFMKNALSDRFDPGLWMFPSQAHKRNDAAIIDKKTRPRRSRAVTKNCAIPKASMTIAGAAEVKNSGPGLKPPRVEEPYRWLKNAANPANEMNDDTNPAGADKTMYAIPSQTLRLHETLVMVIRFLQRKQCG